MQEYVEERTVAISVKAGKLSGRALAAACKKVLAEMKKHHEAAKRPHGRQSVKKLMNHYGTKSAMTLVGAPRDFDRIAKEFHVDYAFHKTSPGHYLLFFKADQADAITAAFSKYTEKVMGRSQERPSIFTRETAALTTEIQAFFNYTVVGKAIAFFVFFCTSFAVF